MSHLPWQGNEDSEFQHAARLQCTIFRHREVEVCPWSATIPSVYFASTNLDIRSTRDETEHTLIWLTNGPSLKATQPSVSLAQGQCFAYCCRKSWKLVAGPCLRNFMEKRQLQNELLDVALLFSRAKIILFSTEFGSLTAVKQLLTDGPSIKSWQHPRNDDSFGNNERLEIQNWNPFANARKGAHTLMPSINERSAIQAMPL